MPSPLEVYISNEISSAATKTTMDLSSLINNMKASGMSDSNIKDKLLEDLWMSEPRGGRIFGGYRNAIKSSVKNGVGYASNEAAKNKWLKEGVKEFRWVSVGDKSVCIDCEERHGEEGTFDFIAALGLPKSGFSICQSNCRCQIVPKDYKEEKPKDPILRKKTTEEPATTPKPKRNNILLRGYQNASVAMEKFYKSLDNKIKMSAVKYVGGDHKLVNPMLRGNYQKTTAGKMNVARNTIKAKLKEGKELIEDLKKFCEISPDYTGTVYRHVGFSEYGTTGLKKAREILDWFKDNQGGMFSNKTFWSTSNNANLNYGGYGNLNLDFTIKSKTGTVLNGLNNIKSKTGIREDEILFAPDTQFKIVKAKEVKRIEKMSDGYKFEHTVLEVTLQEI
tara:strand:- start:571 stop:1746 length:1176 start_codon:yes stop_codon:yes gene_type:complete